MMKIEQIQKMLTIYEEAYEKVKDMSKDAAYEYLYNRKLNQGLCRAFNKYIFPKTFVGQSYATTAKFLGIKHGVEYKWKTPFYYISFRKHPKLGLIPRIKFLKKSLTL